MAMSRSLGGRSLTTRPPIEMVPSVISSSPAIIRRAVDLPQPGGPDEDHELVVPDVEVEPLDDRDLVEALGHVLEPDVRHQFLRCAVLSAPALPRARARMRADSGAIAVSIVSPLLPKSCRRSTHPPDRPAPLLRDRHLERRRRLPAVDGDDDGLLRLGVAPEKRVEVPVGRHRRARSVREGGMCPPDADQLLVVGAKRLVARLAGAGQDLAVAPGHVAAVVRPVAARPCDFFAVIDHRNAARGQLQERREAEEREIAVQELERAGHVVRGKKVREEVSRADLVARLEVAVEGDGPAAAQEPPDDASGKGEVEPRVDLVPFEPRIQDGRVSPPHLAQEEEALPERRRGCACGAPSRRHGRRA